MFIWAGERDLLKNVLADIDHGDLRTLELRLEAYYHVREGVTCKP